MGRFIKGGLTKTIKSPVTGGIDLPAGTTAQRDPDPDVGTFRYNTDTSAAEVYNGIGFDTVAKQGNVSITKDSFTGDGSTTTYTLSVTPPSENSIFVFVGNVFQNPGVAFTLSGADITFSSAPPLSHTIVVLHGFDSTEVS